MSETDSAPSNWNDLTIRTVLFGDVDAFVVVPVVISFIKIDSLIWVVLNFCALIGILILGYYGVTASVAWGRTLDWFVSNRFAAPPHFPSDKKGGYL